MNRLNNLNLLGQSIWLDLLNRDIMNSGKLKELIDNDGLAGLTSNPSIFEKAILGSSDYDEDIVKYSKNGSSNADVFLDVEIADIRRAADIFKPVFDRTAGKDGFVSIEVTPDLAHDAEGTIKQVRELWSRVNRKNAMVKIPGTKEGLIAIRQCLREGININVTLLFGIPRYKEITEAFMGGLEDRLKDGHPIDHVSSVASFFLSRIDVMIDPMLKEKNAQHLYAKIAIASAKKAYQVYLNMINSRRFKALESKGAQRQRVLFASTSTKDPSLSDVLYVDTLIGKETINTLPLETINAFRDHGTVAETLTQNLEQSEQYMNDLKNVGIDIDEITQKLEDEGVEKFNVAYAKLMKSIEEKKAVKHLAK